MSVRSFRRAREREIKVQAEREQRLTGRSKAAIAAGAGLGATAVFAPAADAATFPVTNLNDSGAGSLRQAVEDANNLAGADVVTFQTGLSGTITLTTGEIDIEEGVDIQGPGASTLAVSGNDSSRIFYANTDVNGERREVVSISGLTLRDGDTTGEGGAISSVFTDLRLTAMTLTANHADNQGGALYQDSGPLTITDSSFTGNDADRGGGAVYTDGDRGNSTADNVTITSSAFTGNVADDDGGAMYIDDLTGGDVLIQRSTIANNEANIGGGIHDYGPEGSLTIRESTISGNTANDNGGGLNVGYPEGPVQVINTTISGNTATTEGGGVYVYNLYDVPVSFLNSTIVGNSAGTAGGGIYRLGDNDGGAPVDRVTVSSTIVAGNTNDDLAEPAPPEEGSFVLGFSLIQDPGTATTTESPAGSNIFGADPQLGPLANNGGPTQTHHPALSSPAVDAGISNGLATDQRGLARTQDISAVPNRAGSDATDIGSVEIQSASCQGALVPSKTGTETGDEITGTDGPDALFGAGGDDTIAGLRANDCIEGGAGSDDLSGDQENDIVLGGPDRDRVFGDSGRDRVKGEAGKDTVKGGGGKDKVSGGAGKDLLNGQGAKDKVKGGAGKDRVKGGPKKDRLKGNAGADKLNAIDGTRDRVNCGGGDDVAKVDEEDKVSRNCETVKAK